MAIIAARPHSLVMSNTGKPTEEAFEKRIALLGKRAHLYRFDDAAAIRGKTGVTGYAKKQPSDYLLTLDGLTRFVEVKSSNDPTAFRFSLLKPGQVAAMRQVHTAGGCYQIVVHSLVLDKWFRLEGLQVLGTNPKSKSIIWDLMPPLMEF